MDFKNLAVYSTAKMFFTQTTNISVSIGVVFQNRIIQKYGKVGELKKLNNLFKDYLLFQFLVIIPNLICISFIAISFIFRQ